MSGADAPYESKNIKISVDGKKVILLNEEDEQLKSLVSEGVIYVPIESFIKALGGDFTYNEENNQITIQLSTYHSAGESAESLLSESNYSEEEISSLLLSGRWTMKQSTGESFLDFKADHTGLISTIVKFSWSVNNNTVILDYTSQGKDYHMPLVFQVEGGKLKLLREDNSAFILNDSSNALLDIMGEWNLVGDESSCLNLMSDGQFELKVSGMTYRGNWAYGNNTLMLMQNDIQILGNYNGTSIGLKIDGRTFTFTR